MSRAATAGAKMKVNVFRVPLTTTGAHDVKAMLTASLPPALLHRNPNNPTGTMTPKEDIVWLVNNKPDGSVVLVDEAYHHFSTHDSCIDLVAADKDVIVLRTFSKVYGMAGLRGGFLIAKPELQAKVSAPSASPPARAPAPGAVAISTAAACTASLKDQARLPSVARSTAASARTSSSGWTRTTTPT